MLIGGNKRTPTLNSIHPNTRSWRQSLISGGGKVDFKYLKRLSGLSYTIPSALIESQLESLYGNPEIDLRKLLIDEYTQPALGLALRPIGFDYLFLPIIKVRRTSDNAQADVYGDLGSEWGEITENSPIVVTSGSSSETTLGGFVREGSPTANGLLPTWFDQSGNGINFSQATAGNQPLLYSNGALVTAGGRPAIRFTANTGMLTGAHSVLRNVNGATVFLALSLKASGFGGHIFNISAGPTVTAARLALAYQPSGATSTLQAFGRRQDSDELLLAIASDNLFAPDDVAVITVTADYTAGILRLRYNGAVAAQNTSFHSGGPTSDTNSVVSIGSNRALGFSSTVDFLCGPIIYNSLLPDDRIAAVERALANYAGVTLA